MADVDLISDEKFVYFLEFCGRNKWILRCLYKNNSRMCKNCRI